MSSKTNLFIDLEDRMIIESAPGLRDPQGVLHRTAPERTVMLIVGRRNRPPETDGLIGTAPPTGLGPFPLRWRARSSRSAPKLLRPDRFQ